jgi:hypothetical protein
MSPLPIYAGLNFSTTASPSLTCLQWSGDGQVFFVTKNTIFIMVYAAPCLRRASFDRSNDTDPKSYPDDKGPGLQGYQRSQVP